MQRNGRKINRKPSLQLNATFHCLNQVGNIGVAGIVARVSIDDADDGSRERIVAVPESLNECLAEKEGEVRVAVGGEVPSKTGCAGWRRDYGLVEVVVVFGMAVVNFLFHCAILIDLM